MEYVCNGETLNSKMSLNSEHLSHHEYYSANECYDMCIKERCHNTQGKANSSSLCCNMYVTQHSSSRCCNMYVTQHSSSRCCIMYATQHSSSRCMPRNTQALDAATCMPRNTQALDVCHATLKREQIQIQIQTTHSTSLNETKIFYKNTTNTINCD